MNVTNLDHINLTVGDLKESLEFYKNIFGFEKVEGGVRAGIPWAIARSGNALLCMYERTELAAPEDSPQMNHRINHFGLRISDRDIFESALSKHKIEVEYGGAIRYPFSLSWYICDPTGHEIEVALWDNDEIKFESQLATVS